MKKEELDKLWELYRKFCIDCSQAGMVNTTAEFLVWLEKFRLTP